VKTDLFLSGKWNGVSKSKMSSYRPNYSNNWREREAAKARARKEEAAKAAEIAQMKKIEKTEVNFPSMSNVVPTSKVVFDNNFADLAETWRITEEREKAFAALHQKKETRIHVPDVFIPRFRPNQATFEEPEVYEAPIVMPPKVDEDGWQEVVHSKARRTPREMTERELARKFAETGSDYESGEEDHNGELFDSNRHDHR
jgi:hypothetical protein